MLFYNTTIIALQEYLVKGDASYLSAAIAGLEGERDKPSLLKDPLVLPEMTTDEIDQAIRKEGSIKVRLANIGFEGELRENHFVRVFAADQEEGTCLILNVTFYRDGLVVLVPVMPL